MPLRYLLKKARHDRFERFNIVVSILLAGWVPSIVILFVSYTVLGPRLESKILRDRQTFVQLISRLVGDDLSRTQGIIDYYQTLPDVSRILNSSNPQSAAQQWIGTTFYSHPRIDGMFLTGRDGRLIASIPYNPAMIGKDLDSNLWRPEADKTSVAFVSPVHPRFSDKRIVTDIIGAVRTPDKNIAGYLGVSVLVERIGRRLATIQFADQSTCQVIDQTGRPLFTNDFRPNPGATAAREPSLPAEISQRKTGNLERGGNLYSFAPLETAGWTVVVKQPKAIDRVLSFGTPFQLVEQPFQHEGGMTHFVNITLLRLQAPDETIQGVLYLVEDKTRDVTLRHELINANAAKDQFLALLSHELRNPLSPVIAMVAELEASAPRSEKVHAALEVIRRNVELEARLIDDLLDVTRIAKGKLQLSFEIVDVHEILRRAYEICRE